MMYTAQLDGKGPFSIRYPKGRGVLTDWETPMQELEIGKGRKIREGKDVAIITIGHVGNYALEASEKLEKENISTSVYDIRFLKPIDEQILKEIFDNHKKIITVEDGTIIGGLGSAVMEFMTDHNYESEIKRLGIPDNYIEHGTCEELQKECGYDVEGIVRAAKEIVK